MSKNLDHVFTHSQLGGLGHSLNDSTHLSVDTGSAKMLIMFFKTQSPSRAVAVLT